MSTRIRLCHHCNATVDPVLRIGRRDRCIRCGYDLHCCLNCEFHDPRYNNECRENQAERQVEKQPGNFCEYFSFKLREPADPATAARKDDPRAKLEALFRKS